MKCPNCQRELNPESRFCDMCGTKIELQEVQKVCYTKVFNTRYLLMGISISLFITLVVTAIATHAGFPLLFGGLFLPFFWDFKKKDDN